MMIKKMNRWVFLTLTGVLFFGWMVSAASGQSYRDGPDVRIVDTYAGTLTKIDFHPDSGNLFALVRYITNNNWSLYLSTDRGSTWDLKYDRYNQDGFLDVDLVVAGDYLYVGYVNGDRADNVNLQRFFVSSGERDSVYGFRSPLDTSPHIFTDIALAADQSPTNIRIYCAAIQSDNTIRYAWSAFNDPTVFVDSSPAGFTAAEGLDMAFNTNYENGWFLFLSYIGNDNGVHVLRRNPSTNTWEDIVIDSTFTGTNRRTAVSAYNDLVILGYEESYPNGQGIKVSYSYTAGDTWSQGPMAVPDPGEGDYQMPDLTTRGGQGAAITYSQEKGDVDDVIIKYHRGYGATPWSGPIRVNDYSPDVTLPIALEWAPPDDPTAMELSFGLIYFGDADPYFSRFQQWCCDAPVSITYPSADIDKTFTVYWPAVTGATGYSLERAKNASFISSKTTVYNGPSTSCTETSLIDGVYYYRVRLKPLAGAVIGSKAALLLWEI